MTVLTTRGYRGPGRGRVTWVEAPPEWRGTSVQVCGLNPWVVGSSAPTIGVPVGRHLLSGEAVCCDPVSWFERSKLLLNPSLFILGLPGLGKSSITRRLVIGLAATGTVPLILGDLKPDYVATVRALGGQVITLGRGLGSLNPLDVGALDDAADRCPPNIAQRLREEAHGRRLNLVASLIVIARGQRLTDQEQTLLSQALRELGSRRSTTPPVMRDLVQLLNNPTPAMRATVLDRGQEQRYFTAADPLVVSLMALLDGPLGSVFATQTTQRLRLDATAVCMDVSGVSTSDYALQAAVLMACWGEGYATIEGHNALADAGLAPQRRFFVVLDELWRALRFGEGLVDRIDELTRLNRSTGVSQVMISHSTADLEALANPEDRAKAKGFIERAGGVVVGGLPLKEFTALSEIVSFTKAEKDMITSWSTPPGWGVAAAPPGVGNFMIKVGSRPGLPVHVDLTEAEIAADIHNTNQRWAS